MNFKTIQISVCFILLPILVYSQIGREFNMGKVNGPFNQFIEKSYEGIELDKNGIPIVPTLAEHECINEVKEGFTVESFCEDVGSDLMDLSIRVVINRSGPAINSLEIYSSRKNEESLLRAHRTEVKDGKITSEKIIKDGKVIGEVEYSYGEINEQVSYERMNFENLGRQIEFYTEKDNDGIVFSMQVNDADTVMLLRRTEFQGDSIRSSIVINKNPSTGTIDSILLEQRIWYDAHRNPVMDFQKMIALTDPPEGEPNEMSFLSTFTYKKVDESNDKSNSIEPIENLYGAWRNESNNVEIFFEPNFDGGEQRFFGSSYLLESAEPTPEEHLANKTIWIYMLKQDYRTGVWEIDEKNNLIITLADGSILTFSISLKNKTLILRPMMEDLEGELRLRHSI